MARGLRYEWRVRLYEAGLAHDLRQDQLDALRAVLEAFAGDARR